MLLNTDNCDVGTNKSFSFFLVSLMKCNQDEVHLLEQVELIDLIELQHNLTHHRFGRPEYRLDTLSLARNPTSIR